MQNKRKTIILTGLLSLFVPGIGHAFVGFWRRGLFWYGAGLVWWVVFLCLTSPYLIGFFLFTAGVLIWWLGSAAYSMFLLFRSNTPAISLTSKHVLWFFLHCCVVYHFISTFPLKLYRVPSGSMSPTIEIGDFFIATRKITVIERGDIVVFSPPETPTTSYVKRAIGLPGETIEIQNGYAVINNVELKEPYLSVNKRGKRASWEMKLAEEAPFIIPDNSVFVLGDNRDHSYDSRYYGPVGIDRIRGNLLYSFKTYSYLKTLSFQKTN